MSDISVCLLDENEKILRVMDGVEELDEVFGILIGWKSLIYKKFLGYPKNGVIRKKNKHYMKNYKCKIYGPKDVVSNFGNSQNYGSGVHIVVFDIKSMNKPLLSMIRKYNVEMRYLYDNYPEVDNYGIWMAEGENYTLYQFKNKSIIYSIIHSFDVLNYDFRDFSLGGLFYNPGVPGNKYMNEIEIAGYETKNIKAIYPNTIPQNPFYNGVYELYRSSSTSSQNFDQVPPNNYLYDPV